MKKFLVVLTILVLVAGFAFAAVTGYVEAKYKFNFTDAKELTYDISGKHSKVSFTVSTEQAKVDGSNKPYATVTVDVKLSTEFAEKEETLKYDKYTWTAAATNFTFGVVLSDFRIVGENWEIDFLKAVGVGDYAKSAWELDNKAKADRKPIDAPWAFGKSKGITVTYDGYKIGVSGERRKNDAGVYVLDAALRAESKELTLAEGVTGQVALGIGATKKGSADMSFDFGASVKAAYATDDLTVNGAFDAQSKNKKFDADVAVKVAVKPVTVDAYFATSLQTPRLHSLYVLKDLDENVLSVKAVVALDSVTVTVFGEDLINADRLLAVKEEGKFGAFSEEAQFGIYPTLDKIDDILGVFFKNIWFANAGVHYDVQENLSVNAHVGYVRMNLIEGVGHFGNLVFKAGAEYKLEKVTLAADAYVGKEHGKSGDESYNSDLLFGCEVSASSDKLVENAVLSATLHLDKYGVIDLYDSTLIDAYTEDVDPKVGGMYFQVGCKVTF